MKASTKKFVAKLLVLCMIIGLVPVVELALNTDIATLSTSAYDYYATEADTSISAPVTSGDETVVAMNVAGNADSTGAFTATITDEQMAEAVADIKKAEEAEDAKAPVVEIKINAKNAKSVSLNLPKGPMADLGAIAEVTLRINSAAGTLEFDKDVIAYWGDKAVARQGISISFGQKPVGRLNAAQREKAIGKVVYDFSVKSGSTDLGQFGGKANIVLPYVLPTDIKAADVRVFFMDDNGATTACVTSYDEEAQQVKFETTHFSIYVIGDTSMGDVTLPFSDLTEGAWYMTNGSIAYVYNKGLMEGNPDGTFNPDGNTSRAMFAQLIYNLEGKPAPAGESKFTDVTDGQWFEDAITWCAENGLVKGMTETTFEPDTPITREQMVTLLYRYAEFKQQDVTAKGDLSAYTDADQIGDFAVDAMTWAIGAGVVQGMTETTIVPGDPTNRAQIATLFMNYLSK